MINDGSIFPHQTGHKVTRVPPDGKTRNQINLTTISRVWRRRLLDRGEMKDEASNHHLLVETLRTILTAYNRYYESSNSQYMVKRRIPNTWKIDTLLNCQRKVTLELARFGEELCYILYPAKSSHTRYM